MRQAASSAITPISSFSHMLPFDAHNHVHLGPVSVTDYYCDLMSSLSGMAVMSTHPRDFSPVLNLAKRKNQDSQQMMLKVVPCLGVHPWFLHELEEEEWTMKKSKSSGDMPKWVVELEELLLENPDAPVGEIGLDNFHFDPITKQLTTPLERQVDAFRFQLYLAAIHQRPVSIHCVRAMGKLMDTIQEVYRKTKHWLPPKLYFHAFGGKAATATQFIKTLEKASKATDGNDAFPKVYFGFAPIVNFASPKTMDVIREVGLERLVLETDHEDVRRIPSSMERGVEEIAKALSVTRNELIRITNNNAGILYNL